MTMKTITNIDAITGETTTRVMSQVELDALQSMAVPDEVQPKGQDPIEELRLILTPEAIAKLKTLLK